MNEEQKREVAEQVTAIIQAHQDSIGNDTDFMERRDKAHVARIAYLEQTCEVLEAANKELRQFIVEPPETRICNSCDWVGWDTETLALQPHGPFKLCPECHSTTESVTPETIRELREGKEPKVG